MDTDNFIVYIKAEDIAKDVEARFVTSNYELDRLLPKAKNKASDGVNKKRMMWKKNERVCCIKSKNIYLFNRE